MHNTKITRTRKLARLVLAGKFKSERLSWRNMSNPTCLPNRRNFFNFACAVSPGLAGLTLPQSASATDAQINLIGPKPGYSPQIGTLVSMLTWMQTMIHPNVRGLTEKDLDHYFDANANTIGALLLHLAATETYYQMNTFEGKKWDSWSDEVKQRWDPAMNLGKSGRDTIKGHDLAYYFNILQETRDKSLAEFRRRDDAWLLSVDQKWGWGPTNNYCKWFHVCDTSRTILARSHF